jgi:hypothetical protein
MTSDDPIRPIESTSTSDAYRGARDFILRPLQPLKSFSRYLRYQMILQRRKNRQNRKRQEPPGPPSSGLDIQA